MNNNRDIMVSVCCITYNQEEYIRQCLDSILAQKTDFCFEVIIHDDASTDRTSAILMEYKEKYGEKIRLIQQKENQFSKGVLCMCNALKCVKGRYIAFCEGDDFWIDEHKLQKQYEIMEKEPSASWCTHYVQCVDEQGKEIDKMTLPSLNQEIQCRKSFSSEETLSFLIKNGIQITSYFIRTASFRDYYENIPEFASVITPVEDESMVRYCASVGDMVFLPEIMTCYRMLSKGSWTANTEVSNKMLMHYEKMLNMIRLFDEFTNHRYAEVIERDIIDKEWKKASFAKDYRTMMKKKYRSYRKELPFKTQIKMAVLQIFG